MATNENIQDINKVLHDACYNWDVQGIKDALRHGADINNLNDSGESPLSHAIFGITGSLCVADRNVTDEEWLKTRERVYNECIPIIELLLDNGADIDLFDEDKCGPAPLHQAYLCYAVPVVKYLLDKGANPNTNCYRKDIGFLTQFYRSWILGDIKDSYNEGFEKEECEIKKLVLDAGGRVYDWDYAPWFYDHIGKFFLFMNPALSCEGIFYDNEELCCGTYESVTVESPEGEFVTISLSSVEGLHQWYTDFCKNVYDPNYDWKSWHKRGQNIAKQVAELLPDYVALFYLFDNDKVTDPRWRAGRIQLCKEGDPLRIK